MNVFQIKANIEMFLEYLCGFRPADELSEELASEVDGSPEKDQALYDKLLSSRNDKIEALCAVLKNKAALAEAIAAEKKAMHEREKAAKNTVERLKGFLSMLLTDSEGNFSKYESPACRISWRRSEEVAYAEGFDIENLPAEFVNVKIEKNPKAMELKKAIKAGAELPGVYVKQNNNIQIK